MQGESLLYENKYLAQRSQTNSQELELFLTHLRFYCTLPGRVKRFLLLTGGPAIFILDFKGTTSRDEH